MENELLFIMQKLELELLQPDVRRSADRLNELLADDFIEIGASGRQYTKEDILRILPTSPESQFTIQDFTIKEISSDTIMATYNVERTTHGTEEKTLSLRSSLWRKHKGHWQIFFHQGTSRIK